MDAPIFWMAPWQRSIMVKVLTGFDIRPHETNDPIRRAVRVAMMDALMRDYARRNKPLDMSGQKRVWKRQDGVS